MALDRHGRRTPEHCMLWRLRCAPCRYSTSIHSIRNPEEWLFSHCLQSLEYHHCESRPTQRIRRDLSVRGLSRVEGLMKARLEPLERWRCNQFHPKCSKHPPSFVRLRPFSQNPPLFPSTSPFTASVAYISIYMSLLRQANVASSRRL